MTRTIKKSGIALTASLAMLAIGLAGCSTPAAAPEASDEGAKPSIGTITVATGTQFPPMGYTDTDTNELVGFEIDLGEALAKELGADIKWEGMLFNQFLSSVATKRVDMVLGAMLTTPERLESVTSVEYLATGFQFSTSPEAAKEHGIKEITDFCGLTVAASRNSSYKVEIDKWSAENCDVPVEVLDTDGSPDARLQLKQGRAQGIMQTAETISYLSSTEPESFVAIGEPITESFYGMLFDPKNTELRDQLKGALEALMDNGTYAKLLKEWGLDAQAMDAPTVELGK
jgi:polar amino acid transport system substrate-binding protein